MRRLLLFVLMCWPFLFAGSICNVVVGQKVVTTPSLLEDDNIQAYYSFEQNLTDSINGNNLSGGSPSYSTSGVCSGSYALIADDQTMRSNADLSANFPGKSSATTSAMTVFAKVRLANIPKTTQGGIVAMNKSVFIAVYQFYVYTDGTIQMIWVNSSGTLHKAISEATLSTNTDYFVACVWTGSNIMLYYGTTPANIAQTGDTLSTSGSLRQLSDSSFGVGCIPGYGSTEAINVDCLAIYDRALSLSELQTLADEF